MPIHHQQWLQIQGPALDLTAASLALRHSDRSRVAAFLLPKLSGSVLLQEVVEVPCPGAVKEKWSKA